MKMFYLVRHGDFINKRRVFHGRLPLQLSASGRRQAKALAEFFSRMNIKAIYSSAVVRCRETAEIIAHRLDLPIHFDRRLLEVLSAVQGMELAAYRKAPGGSFQAVKTLGGETIEEVEARAWDFFQDLNHHQKGNCLVVSHGDPIYFLYLRLQAGSIKKKGETYEQLDYPGRGSIIRVTVDGKKIQVDPPFMPVL